MKIQNIKVSVLVYSTVFFVKKKSKNGLKKTQKTNKQNNNNKLVTSKYTNSFEIVYAPLRQKTRPYTRLPKSRADGQG